MEHQFTPDRDHRSWSRAGLEFDDHGALAGDKNTQDEKLTICVRDVQNGRSETIHLLPTGQVQEA
jgi:hypothetical protein